MQTQEAQLLSVFISETFGKALLYAFLGGVFVSLFITILSGLFWNRHWRHESRRIILISLCFCVLYAVPAALYLHTQELLSNAMSETLPKQRLSWQDITAANSAAELREHRMPASPEGLIHELILHTLPGVWQGIAPKPYQISLSPELKKSLSFITRRAAIPPESPFYTELTRVCLRERNLYLRRCFISPLTDLAAFAEWAFILLLPLHLFLCACEAFRTIRRIPLHPQFAKQ